MGEKPFTKKTDLLRMCAEKMMVAWCKAVLKGYEREFLYIHDFPATPLPTNTSGLSPAAHDEPLVGPSTSAQAAPLPSILEELSEPGSDVGDIGPDDAQSLVGDVSSIGEEGCDSDDSEPADVERPDISHVPDAD